MGIRLSALAVKLLCIAAFESAQAQCPPTFPNKVHDVGIDAYLVELGDLNLDGRLDVVALSSGPPRIARLLNDPVTFLGQRITVDVGTSPQDLDLVDLDSDGFVDVVTTNASDSTLTVLYGDGSGGFAPGQVISMNAQPNRTAFGHLNGDSHIDIVTMSVTNGLIGVRLGQGARTFGSLTMFTGTGITGYTMFCADVDTDGDDDLVVLVSSWDGIMVLLCDGQGAFEAALPSYVGGSVAGMAVGDVDSSGIIDAAVTRNGMNDVAIMRGTGTGFFTLSDTVPIQSGPGHLVLADRDEDGDVDIAANAQSPDRVVLCDNDGNGSFHVSSSTGVGVPGNSPFAIGDLNQDGHPELVRKGYAGSYGITVVLGSEQGLLGESLSYEIADPSSLAIADLQLDGAPDIVTGGTGGISVVVNEATSSGSHLSSPMTYLTSGDVTDIDWADLNNDGWPDIGSVEPESLVFSVHLGTGTSTLGQLSQFDMSAAAGGTPFRGGPESLALGDMNGDGNTDAVFGMENTENILGIMIGLGNGSFVSPSSLPATVGNDYYTDTSSVAVSDLNLDGDLDIAVTVNRWQSGSGYSGYVLAAMGNGLGGITGSQLISVDPRTDSVILDDLDHDGFLDIAGVRDGGLFTLLATSPGTFSSPTTYSLSETVHWLTTLDCEGDGFLDLLATTEGAIHILPGDGSGAFYEGDRFSAGAQLKTSAATDHDGDGREDVVVAGGGGEGFVGLLANSHPSEASVTMYGTGKPGTNGISVLTSDGAPVLGTANAIRISNGLPGAPSWLLLGFEEASIPFDGGTMLLVLSEVLPLPPFDVNGDVALVFTVPTNPGLCGLELFFQCMFIDPGATGAKMTAQSNGLKWVPGS